MSVRMLAIGLTFLQTIAITQVFGSEVFGLLSFALSISAIAILFLSAGLDQLLMRDIARLGTKVVARSKRWEHTWHLVRKLVIPVTLLISISGSTLVAVTGIAGAYKSTLFTALLLLPLVLCRKYLEAICQGSKLVLRSLLGSQVAYPLLMILGALYVWFFGIEASAETVSLTYFVALAGSLIASFLFIFSTIKKITNKENSIKSDSDFYSDSPGEKALLKSGVYFSLVSIGFVLGQHIDVLLMGIISSPENVAIVRIAARVAEMVGLMRAIVMLQYKPLLAEAHAKQDWYLLQNNVYFMTKVFTLTGVIIAAIFLIFAEEAMFVFGKDFVDGSWAMRIYVLGVLITMLLGPGEATLSMCGYEKLAARILMTSIVIQTLLNLILIPIFGAVGCAISNLISLCYLAITTRYFCKKHLNIRSSIFDYFIFHHKK